MLVLDERYGGDDSAICHNYTDWTRQRLRLKAEVEGCDKEECEETND